MFQIALSQFVSILENTFYIDRASRSHPIKKTYTFSFVYTQNILLVKNENERLGMHIKGGLNGQRGNPLDPADEGVFVSKINSSGAARRDGRLKVCIT